jgi:hypothetical protein
MTMMMVEAHGAMNGECVHLCALHAETQKLRTNITIIKDGTSIFTK